MSIVEEKESFDVQPRPKQRKGFALWDKTKLLETSSKGGRKAHELGVAHEFSSDEARAAGLKGGLKTSADRQHMRDIGKRGAMARIDNANDREAMVRGIVNDDR